MAEKTHPPTGLAWDRRGRFARIGVSAALLAAKLFPLYYLVMSSLKSQGEFTVNQLLPPSRGVHFENWTAVWPSLAQPAVNSTVISLGTTALLLLIMAPCAYVFTWHRFPGKEKLYTFAITTMMLPSVLTFVPLYVQIRDLGLMDTKWAVILPGVAGNIGVSLFLLRAFFTALPSDLVEAARMDGAAERQILSRIILPLSVPGVMTVAVLTIAGMWNQFLWPLVTLTSSGERVANVAAAYFSSDPLAQQSPTLLMSGYLMSAVPLILMLGLLLKYFMAGAAEGSLKG